jgi:H+-translocating NAD(P) transhydrogenase subunit beta
MGGGVLTMAYLASGILFILSLGGLSQHETARKGNIYGVLGLTIAIIATVIRTDMGAGIGLLAVTLTIGVVIGGVLAARVEMTNMPQLVAILHSFVGLAAVLVGVASYLGTHGQLTGVEKTIHEVEVFLGVFIGGLTFTGSVLAFAKLQGLIGSKPLLLPGRHFINIGMVLVSIYFGYLFIQAGDTQTAMQMLLAMTAVSFVFGAHLVWAIGGADMPVVVSMLNSYSGWAASATGFMLSNDLLIITGALVGSSGAILSYIMCKAMNRSIVNVIFGGFGATPAKKAGAGDEVQKEYVTSSIDEVADLIADARKIIVIPGYGMAVAQAQHPMKEITDYLKKQDIEIKFAIHPVAGRLPGHMNVLLAEANVPYDIVEEMDEINDDFQDTDLVLVVGANDIVNPGALDDPSSPIFGMPVLEAWKASNVVILKRSMGQGYSAVDNPLFYLSNSMMLFGDAKASIEGLRNALMK